MISKLVYIQKGRDLSTHSGQSSFLSWAPTVFLAAPETPPGSAGPSSQLPGHPQIQ